HGRPSSKTWRRYRLKAGCPVRLTEETCPLPPCTPPLNRSVLRWCCIDQLNRQGLTGLVPCSCDNFRADAHSACSLRAHRGGRCATQRGLGPGPPEHEPEHCGPPSERNGLSDGICLVLVRWV